MATMLRQSPSPKRVKLDDSQQIDSDNLSFLDDIDVDEIVDCLTKCDKTTDQENIISSKSSTPTIKQPGDSTQWTKCDKTTDQENIIRSKSSTPTIKQPGDSTRCSDYSLSEDDGFESFTYISPRKDAEKFIEKLEKKMFHLFQEHYVSSIIHHGKYSTVIQIKDSACKTFAVKFLNSEGHKYYGKAKEKMLLHMQKNIPKDNLFCIYFGKGFSFLNRWCFMMEFYPKTLSQAMRKYKKPFHIKKVQELARQLVAAVTILKHNGIVHSDIQPSHILLNSTDEKLRLCGFDAAYYYGAGSGKNSPKTGRLNYRPPEVILGYPSGFAMDVWATALVLVEMATGSVVFPGYTNNDILFRQMCMLGSIPNVMLAKSRYKSDYFDGNTFKRQVGNVTKDTYIFYETDKLAKMVLKAQTYHWLKKETQKYKHMKEKKKLFKKVYSFLELTKQMIVIVPEDRFSIDIVYSEPFIFEMFD